MLHLMSCDAWLPLLRVRFPRGISVFKRGAQPYGPRRFLSLEGETA